MTKLIQICASEDDLFGLDAEGAVYHYNFNTNSWMRLGRVRRGEAGGGAAEGQPAVEHDEVAAGRGRLEAAPTSQGEAHEAPRSVRDGALCECGRPLPRSA
jgi:hypothetical protein